MAGALRGLARRVLDRVAGPQPVGEGFVAGSERAFAALDDNAESTFSSVGAALIGSWEVLLADVSRALGPIPQEQRGKLVERISDALVPTMSTLQHGERPFKAALQGGVKVALRSGRLSDATEPLAAHLETIGEPVATGWSKTVQYLQPVVETLPEPDKVRASLAFLGGELRRVFDAEATSFRHRIEALPRATALEPALFDAMESWKQGVIRGLEIAIYDARTRLVEAAHKGARAGG